MDTSVVLAALLTVIVSPVMMWIIRQTLEGGMPSGMFDPRTQSWAYMFGDTFALSLAMAASVHASHNSSWVNDPRWITAAVVVAFAVSAGHRYLGFKVTPQEHHDRLNAPSKIWHDLGVFPIVGFGLTWQGVPGLVNGSTLERLLILGGLVAWGVLAIYDVVVRKVDIANQHPPVHQTALARFFR